MYIYIYEHIYVIYIQGITHTQIFFWIHLWQESILGFGECTQDSFRDFSE